MKAPAAATESATGPKLWVVMARAHGSLASYIEACIAKEGLCLSDFMVLEVLLHKGPMTISEIGEKVLLANASMTSAVDRLERRSFVFRKNSDSDRRVRIVDLTDQGRAFISDLFARHVLDIEAVTNVLTAREQFQLRSLLKKLGRSAETALNLRTASPGRTGKAEHIHTEGISQ
jgi:MarR family 2-MHQ and catechol resistance regulon transcriptional repressor